jgi:hypothetical protein
MATDFPENLDNFTNPDSNNPLSNPSHSEQHANANDAIEALQAKVGIDGSTDPNSLDYRISQLEISPLDTEQIQDAIAAAFAAGDQTDITVSYNDALDSLTLLVNNAQTAGYTSVVQHYVKNSTGSTINAGTPVYISGATGANMLISKASNSGESTSSKTFGLLAQDLAQNAIGFVVTEGLLSGLDTHIANAGDPVWLGANGQLVYGLANKPIAPAHLVFIGIVTRAHAQVGQIFVKIQNGFELNELHDVDLDYSNPPADGDVLSFNSITGMWTNSTAVKDIENKLGLEGNNDLEVTGIENPTVIDSFDSTAYTTASYRIQIKKDNLQTSSNVTAIYIDGSIYMSEYDVVSNTDTVLANLEFTKTGSIINLLVTPLVSPIIVRYYRTALKN